MSEQNRNHEGSVFVKKPARALADVWLASLFVAVLLLCGSARADEQIAWQTGTVTTVPGDPSAIASVLERIAQEPDARHLVIQFDAPIRPAERAALRSAGLELLSYLGNHAFFATISPSGWDAERVARTRGLLDARPVERAWKLDHRILTGEIPDWAVVAEDSQKGTTVGVYVLFHWDVNLSSEARDAVKRHGAVVRDALESVNGLVVELPWSNMDGLADEDVVQWIEWPLPPMEEVNDSNSEITEANIVQASPYNLDGTGVTVLVYDGGTARATHVDFQGRLTVHDASGMTDHATHVAGTIGGAGIGNATYEGMAPGVTLLSYGLEWDGTDIFLYSNPGDIETDYHDAIYNHGADIANNSIGTNTESNGFDCEIQGNYGVTSQLIDTIVRGDGSNPLFTEPFRIVWANGNERVGSRCDIEGYGDYYSTAPPAGAKNHIAVGALNSNDDSMTWFSSWGPVDDGRMKPDVTAPGCQVGGDGGVTSCSDGSDTAYDTKCGTSMASPTTCGLSALLLQDFRNQFPTEPDPRNSMLKAFLAHNAQDILNTGPDYQSGYGSVRIQQTVDFMRTGNFLEAQLDQDDLYFYTIPVDSSSSPLKVTLAWDDFPGTPNVDPALINDLDLRVCDPGGTCHYPWILDPTDPGAPATRSSSPTGVADHVNNLVQVFVDSPAVGQWLIEISGFDVPNGPQPFSLCASPSFLPCSTKGMVWLDAPVYACESTVGIKLVDCDLNTDDQTIETVQVTIASDSEPAGETLLLTETGPDTAAFANSIPLSETNNTGVLEVANGDTVTVTYIDADDGFGGVNVVVQASAIIDCAPPVISNVQADPAPRSATVSFQTNEPALVAVHYGFSCGSLTETAAKDVYETVHEVALTDLVEDSDYFYAIEAEDGLGNGVTDDNGGACHTFTTVNVTNYFTEDFVPNFVEKSGADNDLDYTAITFTPGGSEDFYSACTETVLSFDELDGTLVSLSDDEYHECTLTGGETVSLYGTSYDTFYIGSNGCITFDAGDTDFTESVTEHFGVPRISVLFDDFNPAIGGTISWKQLGDSAVVRWDGVPEHGTLNSNTFQVEMFFDDTIRVSYLSVAADDGIVGLSSGEIPPPGFFFETDLSESGVCGGRSGGGAVGGALALTAEKRALSSLGRLVAPDDSRVALALRNTARVRELATNVSYEIVDLGTLEGKTWSEARDVNAIGQVVGHSRNQNEVAEAFIWMPEPAYGLPEGISSIAGPSAYWAWSMNKAAEISTLWTGQGVGLWLPEARYGLDAGAFFPGMLPIRYHEARGINNKTQICGFSWTGYQTQYRAYVWLPYPDYGFPAGLNELGFLRMCEVSGEACETDDDCPPEDSCVDGTESAAVEVNSLGQIVGFANPPGDIVERAFIWDPDTHKMEPLPALYMEWSIAWDINVAGQTVGWEYTDGWMPRAILWEDGQAQDIGTTGGDWARAYAINDWKQVVGNSVDGSGSSCAFTWYDGVMTDLNELVSPYSDWVLSGADGINERGQIVGRGVLGDVTRRAFLLNPIATIRDSEPPDGTIDARQPHPPLDNSLEARQGIGSADEPILIALGAGGLSSLQWWNLCETGIEEVEPGTDPLDPNEIVRVTEVGPGVYELVLARPISAGHWTVITFTGDNSYVSFASLPADVNGDGVSNNTDYNFLYDIIYGLEMPPHGNYSCDINHDGLCSKSDLYVEQQLLCGTGQFIVWNGKELPDNTCAMADPPVVEGAGGRYLAITPPPGSERIALRVTPDCPGGETKYVGEPTEIAPHGFFAELSDTPVFLTSAEWGGTVHATGVTVTPSTDYTVERESEDGLLSASASGTTWIWGDVDNNGYVNMSDIQLAILALQGDYSNVTFAGADLAPPSQVGCYAANRVVSMDDISAALKAHAGNPYPCPACPE